MRWLALAIVLMAASPVSADWNAEKEAFASGYSSEEPTDRVAAVRNLKEFDHPEGMALVLECYRSERDTDVRHALADAMNAIRAVKARDVFRETILKHPDAEARARFCAVFADARMLDRFDMLRNLLRDPAPVVRARALRNLGSQDGGLALDATKLLADAGVDVRMAACAALGTVRSAETCGALVGALEAEKNAEVRWAVVDALQKVTGESLGEDLAAWQKWWSDFRTKNMPEVDRAIARGAEYLKDQLGPMLAVGKGQPGAFRGNDIELLTYALIHAGVGQDDPVLKAGIEHLETMPVGSTYSTAIAAMALADLDPRKYGDRLAEFAQWLADTQCANGQWSYGWLAMAPPVKSKSEKKTSTPSPQSAETTVPEIRIVWKDHRRQANGDNSNTQYALLGLRATTRAGCVIPKEVWKRSLAWFRKAQDKDGGWGYGQGGPGYGSMTVGGLSSVAVCLRELGEHDEMQPEKLAGNPIFKAGFAWLDRNWSVTENPKGYGHVYYYLYGLERAGMILGLGKFGDHDWYAEGARHLIEAQGENGAWQKENANWDTAFAILFLKKATRGYTVSSPGK